MGIFTRSYILTRQSLAVLAQDKELLLFPIISTLSLFFLIVLIITPVIIIAPLKQLVFDVYIETFVDGEGMFDWFFYFVLYILYFLSNLVTTFFNAGLIACAQKRLSGSDPTFRDGVKAAYAYKGKIILWAVFTSTIGIILTILRDRVGWLARFGITILQVSWTLITFFIVPILIFENLSLKDSISRSGKLFKDTWGENLTYQVSTSLFFGIFAIAAIPVFILLFILGLNYISAGPALVWYNITSFSILVLFWMLLGVLASTLDGIFRVALYQYASTGKLPIQYSEELIKGAFKVKNKSISKTS